MNRNNVEKAFLCDIAAREIRTVIYTNSERKEFCVTLLHGRWDCD